MVLAYVLDSLPHQSITDAEIQGMWIFQSVGNQDISPRSPYQNQTVDTVAIPAPCKQTPNLTGWQHTTNYVKELVGLGGEKVKKEGSKQNTTQTHTHQFRQHCYTPPHNTIQTTDRSCGFISEGEMASTKHAICPSAKQDATSFSPVTHSPQLHMIQSKAKTKSLQTRTNQIRQLKYAVDKN